MARKADELLADLDLLGSDEQPTPTAAPATTTSKAPAKQPQPATVTTEEGDNPFDDLEKKLAAKPAPITSRPSTPRLSSSTTSATNKSPKRAEHTPASSGPPSGRTSEDRLRSMPAQARSSGEGSRSYHQSFTPNPEQQQEKVQQESGGGGWWGSMFSAASAAVKQAENLAKEIRGNEEALRWAEQVKGYGVNLQSLSTDIRSRALPTFTSLISHIAPPISAHERLQIHITHDILHYPSLDPLIYSTFSRVMSQVEGGDLLVIQRGSESRSRATSEPQGYRGAVLGGGSSGWTDGPWWREEGVKRDLGAVPGLKEGTRLVRVSAESYAKEFFEPRGGVEEAAKRATETLSGSNPTRSSDIFLAIQAISFAGDKDFFAADARAEQEKQNEPAEVVDATPDEPEEEICFAIYLHDPIHSLSFSALSQPFPQKWASWLDASPNSEDPSALPEDIQQIIESGGVDPREWVAEWMEEVLSLGVGVVAQRYVARRMGVGEGGLGRGNSRLVADEEEERMRAEAAGRGV
ncbi:hypothetical protein LTR37_000091 [Vermiconidia calcicola]|uniref:Uncharacterized protein n=1 Tax=Vermiconidia calcicola TaxID=1690605 RepID=A0ACC3NZB5_9PEZI|nr:hypothetical protein LTR37_000091 [Vermiconidia calcicola]